MLFVVISPLKEDVVFHLNKLHSFPFALGLVNIVQVVPRLTHLRVYIYYKLRLCQLESPSLKDAIQTILSQDEVFTGVNLIKIRSFDPLP